MEEGNRQVDEILALLRGHQAPRPSAANSALVGRVPPEVMQMPSSLPQPTYNSLLQLAQRGSYTSLSLEIECYLEGGWPHLRAQPGFWGPNGTVSPAFYPHLTQVITMLYVKEMFDTVVSRFDVLDRTLQLVRFFQRYNRTPCDPNRQSPRSRAAEAVADFVASFRSWKSAILNTYQLVGTASGLTLNRSAWVFQIFMNLPPTVAAQLEKANRLSTEIPTQLRRVVTAIRRLFVSLDGFYSEPPRHDQFEPFSLASDALALAISGFGGPDQGELSPSDSGSVSRLSTTTWSSASADPDPDNVDMSVSILRQLSDPAYCPLLPSDVDDNGLWTWAMPSILDNASITLPPGLAPISGSYQLPSLQPQRGTYINAGLGNPDLLRPGLTDLLLRQSSQRMFEAANEPTVTPLDLAIADSLMLGPSDIFSDSGWSDVQSQAGSARSGSSRCRSRQPPA